MNRPSGKHGHITEKEGFGEERMVNIYFYGGWKEKKI